MRTLIETIAKKAGADRVIFARSNEANNLLDDFEAGTVAILKDFTGIVLEPKGNGLAENLTIDITIARPTFEFDAGADKNELDKIMCYTACKDFLMQITRNEHFLKLPAVTLTELTERVYDNHMIGYQMRFTIPLRYGYTRC